MTSAFIPDLLGIAVEWTDSLLRVPFQPLNHVETPPEPNPDVFVALALGLVLLATAFAVNGALMGVRRFALRLAYA